MNDSFYDLVAVDFDRLIPWSKRLAAERPSFERLFEQHGVKRVFDTACGSGRHMALFAELGVEVHGADASKAMVELARLQLEPVVRDPENAVLHCTWDALPQRVDGRYDAVLCLGNSLPYVVDEQLLFDSLEGMWSLVAPGGLLLLQYKNFEGLRRSGQRFLPLLHTETPHETLGLRLYDFHAETIDFNIVMLDRGEEGWSMRHHVTPLRPYTPATVMELLERLGARVELYGSLDWAVYDTEASPDTVLLARRDG